MISKETIDKIFSTARVEEVISDFINLKKSGSNYKGLSPFVDEKTPSFMVSPSKQIWKDFSSGKGGNVVTFIMEQEHYTYPEALRYLAKKYNIEIEEDSNELSDSQKELQLNKESLYQLSEVANEYFQNQLWKTEEGNTIGISYFRERSIRDDIIKQFQLGYSPKEWDSFTHFAFEKGYKKEILEQSGLSIFKEGSDKGFDRFRERVLFPIHSFSGRVLGFGGRILQNNAKTAKYVNSPESEIYHKSQVLYGLFHAKSFIIKEDNCYLVEGYMDVISLYQNGIKNVVASSGTSLTVEQIRLIKRLTNNITVLYDGDQAGIKASFRSIDMILEQEMNVKVLLFPDGEDPDSFARKHTADEIEAFFKENSKDFIQFKTDVLLKETNGDPIKKAGLIRDIVGSIALIKNLIQKEIYVKECSRILDISEQVLFSELAQLTQQNIHSRDRNTRKQVALQPVTTSQQEEIDFTYKIEEDILELMLSYGDHEILINYVEEEEPYKTTVIEEIVHRLKEDDLQFTVDFYNRIYLEIMEGIENNQLRTGEYFVKSKEVDITEFAVGKLLKKYSISNNWELKEIYVPTLEQNLAKNTKDVILKYKAIRIAEMNKNLAKELSSGNISEERRLEIFNQIITLDKLLKQIHKLENRVI
ncbi:MULTISPECIES: DNA primase [unclassified Apibacter]|uniref:DNA primase n=1 Tax=unclassified Apibacter TaxID=2630820 RepID=UPI001324819D|nr:MULTISPECIES: DNA primase [unclassified Apibacter]MCX8676792.1 DNA primase [Apibacter sp. B3919]MXO24825.1 DNA primase [Apibacter sp. B3924]MXO26069.1 DNA primase [Apibacter sp. B3813]MXO28020.1 DNA primase [Apibacter sp. B3913]MXO29620.1 DNA primase [Apibacter sp. B3912]